MSGFVNVHAVTALYMEEVASAQKAFAALLHALPPSGTLRSVVTVRRVDEENPFTGPWLEGGDIAPNPKGDTGKETFRLGYALLEGFDFPEVFLGRDPWEAAMELRMFVGDLSPGVAFAFPFAGGGGDAAFVTLGVGDHPYLLVDATLAAVLKRAGITRHRAVKKGTHKPEVWEDAMLVPQPGDFFVILSQNEEEGVAVSLLTPEDMEKHFFVLPEGDTETEDMADTTAESDGMTGD